MDVLETGVIVQPVRRLQDEGTRVFMWLLIMSDNIQPGVSWPPQKEKELVLKIKPRSCTSVPPSLWAGHLRGPRRNKSGEDALRKSRDVILLTQTVIIVRRKLWVWLTIKATILE